jgi:hypothetical protein
MGRVLGIVYRCIATHLIKKAGFSHRTAQTGAVTLVQRSGSALNLNIHFHMLFLDGVYVERRDGSLRFRWVKAPMSAELTRLTEALARRIGRYFERQGLLERDAENSTLAGDELEAGPMAQLLGSSITRADERQKLERLWRYISRPAIAAKRLSLTPNGNVRYQLKTPYRDGTTHVMLLRASCPPPFGPACGGAVRIIACIEDAEMIEKILTHLESKAAPPQARWRLGGWQGRA